MANKNACSVCHSNSIAALYIVLNSNCELFAFFLLRFNVLRLRHNQSLCISTHTHTHTHVVANCFFYPKKIQLVLTHTFLNVICLKKSEKKFSQTAASDEATSRVESNIIRHLRHLRLQRSVFSK